MALSEILTVKAMEMLQKDVTLNIIIIMQETLNGTLLEGKEK